MCSRQLQYLIHIYKYCNVIMTLLTRCFIQSNSFHIWIISNFESCINILSNYPPKFCIMLVNKFSNLRNRHAFSKLQYESFKKQSKTAIRASPWNIYQMNSMFRAFCSRSPVMYEGFILKEI